MKFYLLLLSLFLSISVDAQVGINTTTPYKSADFDIKNTVVSNDTIPRGLLIPKMTEKQRDGIDVSGVDANSLLVYNTDINCYSYYTKSEKIWINLCGLAPPAVISPIDCSDITINGTFAEGVATTSENYLTLNMNVVTPGSYTLEITTTNGYYFYTTGSIMNTGMVEIEIPAYGTPTKSGTDDLAMNGIGVKFKNATCSAKVLVNKPIASFALNCSSSSVVGNYIKGVALTSANYIQITVNVSKTGSYSISTETRYGVKFSSSGVFSTTGAQTINLMGTGTPLVNSAFTVKIKSNSGDGLNECSADIPMILPSMTYAVIGASTGVISWSTAPRSQVLSAASNFSINGLVQINSFKQLWATNSNTTATTYLNSGFNGKYPEIVLFYAQGVTQDDALGKALGDYIKKGGAVIYGAADAGIAGAKSILNGIFTGTQNYVFAQVAGQTQTAQDAYPILQDTENPIVNGVFGNLSNNRNWGENGNSTNTVVLSKLPSNSVQLVSAFNTNSKVGVDPAFSVVWYNDAKNFVYFGSSVGATTAATPVTSNPSYFLSNSPAAKNYGTTSSSSFVFNSALELNAIAWCLRKAADNGINAN